MHLSKPVLQILLVVFVVNTAAAYGACCIGIPASDDAMVMKMPCHQSDDDLDRTSPDDCCLLCLPMMGDSDSVRHSVSPGQSVYVRAITPFLASGVDPPFRPPISHLS